MTIYRTMNTKSYEIMLFFFVHEIENRKTNLKFYHVWSTDPLVGIFFFFFSKTNSSLIHKRRFYSCYKLTLIVTSRLFSASFIFTTTAYYIVYIYIKISNNFINESSMMILNLLN